MKKTYLQPSIEMDFTETETMICASQDITSNGDVSDITYGGVDEDGTIDPASRHQRDLWDDDDEDWN